jgi:hypothetical protein
MGGWVDSGEYVALLSGSWPRSALPNLIEPFSPMTPADLLLHTNKQAGDALRRLTLPHCRTRPTGPDVLALVSQWDSTS